MLLCEYLAAEQLAVLLFVLLTGFVNFFARQVVVFSLIRDGAAA